MREEYNSVLPTPTEADTDISVKPTYLLFRPGPLPHCTLPAFVSRMSFTCTLHRTFEVLTQLMNPPIGCHGVVKEACWKGDVTMTGAVSRWCVCSFSVKPSSAPNLPGTSGGIGEFRPLPNPMTQNPPIKQEPLPHAHMFEVMPQNPFPPTMNHPLPNDELFSNMDLVGCQPLHAAAPAIHEITDSMTEMLGVPTASVAAVEDTFESLGADSIQAYLEKNGGDAAEKTEPVDLDFLKLSIDEAPQMSITETQHPVPPQTNDFLSRAVPTNVYPLTSPQAPPPNPYNSIQPYNNHPETSPHGFRLLSPQAFSPNGRMQPNHIPPHHLPPQHYHHVNNNNNSNMLANPGMPGNNNNVFNFIRPPAVPETSPGPDDMITSLLETVNNPPDVASPLTFQEWCHV